MKVAIVHDWLVGGGAEKVVLELHRMYPDAPIYTSYCTDEWRQQLDNKVVTGFLQKWPFSHLRKYLPVLRIWWVTHLDLSGFDLVISSTGNGEAKGLRVPKTVKHICYCNTPVHFYWRHYQKYLDNPGFGVFDPLARLGLRLLVRPLRAWDLKASRRPDVFIANSSHIKYEIKTYYQRDSVVVHPCVDVEKFMIDEPEERNGFVTMSRLVPHKHIDIIIAACNKLNLPLKVIGRGPELEKLKRQAGSSIQFLTNVSDAERPAQIASAEAFIIASYEDFGITPVEALATGTPVIAYKAGGALDYVIPGKTGEFFDKQTANSLIIALQDFDPQRYDHDVIAKSAEQFSNASFRKRMQLIINKHTGSDE